MTANMSVPINARMMLNGNKFCFAKFLDQTTVERIQNPDANCGHVDPLDKRTASGRRKVMFTTLHDFTVPILQFLLPLVGATLSGNTYTANSSISSTTIIVDKVGAIHRYTECRLSRLILRGQTGTLPCSAEALWIAKDEIEDPSAVWTDGTVDNIFGFPGTTYSIAGNAVDLNAFAFVIDRKLVQGWNASVTVTDVDLGARQTLLATSIPYVAGTKDIYWGNRDSVAGAAHVLAVTNGSDTLTINMPKAIYNPESPSIEGSLTEIRLPMTWEAHRQAATAAFNLVLVNA